MDLTQFRAYDPALGRWWQVDPLASEMSSWTPYNYGFNNPIRFNDPLEDAPGAKSYIANTNDSMGGEDQSEDKNKTYDGGTLPEHTVSAPRSFDGVLGRAADSWMRNNSENSTYGRKREEGLGRETEWWSDTKRAIGYGYSAITTTMLSAFQAAEMGAEFASGNAARGVTTADGFLFRGFTVNTPFNIPVQRFGNMSLGKPDFWGARIGTSQFANRTFAAIHPRFRNPLTQYTTGVIPKGTPIEFGIIGPQGWRYPGGSFQFIVPSRSVINQSSKLISR